MQFTKKQNVEHNLIEYYLQMISFAPWCNFYILTTKVDNLSVVLPSCDRR